MPALAKATSSLPVARQGGGDEPGHVGLEAGVDLQRRGRAAGLDHLARGVVHGLGLVAEHQLRAFAGEEQRRGAADARACAGDDGHLAFKSVAHCLLQVGCGCARCAPWVAARSDARRSGHECSASLSQPGPPPRRGRHAGYDAFNPRICPEPHAARVRHRHRAWTGSTARSAWSCSPARAFPPTPASPTFAARRACGHATRPPKNCRRSSTTWPIRRCARPHGAPDWNISAWTAQPNRGHLALVELERRGKLHALITQNVDELHQIAGNSAQRVIEVHGTVRRYMCWNCGHRGPMSDALDRVRGGEADPPCGLCGGILKSDTISFGQALVPQVIDRAMAARPRPT